MFHYLLEYCIRLCYHSVSTLALPIITSAVSALIWLWAAVSGTLMFLMVSLALAYAVAFAALVYNHGWPRPQFGIHSWVRTHCRQWDNSPMRYFLCNVWELFKITHDLHKPLSVQCRHSEGGSEISLKYDQTIVKAHTSNVTNNFTMAESEHVSHIKAMKTTTILYTRHPQFDGSVLAKEMPTAPLNDDQDEVAPPAAEPAPTKKRPAPASAKPGPAKRGKKGARG